MPSLLSLTIMPITPITPITPIMPITHFLYLASGLFLLGLVGVVLRRSPARALLGLVLALAATGLVMATFARAWGQTGGQVFAILLVILTAVYAMVGAALLRGRG